ncbi:hypothetical protein TD3509T_580040 [Tenacibaculum dicentrarchi]|uniref:GLPGLI family protein n=1 Tax=Tenacibaculum dicentrarchi TaxID=669041 RepID=A0ABM9NYM8_9FLAO|nr:hypothetical protein TD3509T_580040 [Tenacibaculum dicentrarchi]
MKFILLLFIPLLGFSQQNKITIEYDFYDNYRYQETIGVLNCDNETAIFKTFLDRLNTGGKSASNSSGEITIGGDRIDIYRVTNKKNNTLISYDIRKDDIYEITEEVPKMDWKIAHTETKKIANYNCSKATVSFRGRNYTAWYTIQLPFSFGPWKFNGLPGLILEISDITNTFKWRASKIKYPTNTILKVPYEKGYYSFGKVKQGDYLLIFSSLAYKKLIVDVLVDKTQERIAKNVILQDNKITL